MAISFDLTIGTATSTFTVPAQFEQDVLDAIDAQYIAEGTPTDQDRVDAWNPRVVQAIKELVKAHRRNVRNGTAASEDAALESMGE